MTFDLKSEWCQEGSCENIWRKSIEVWGNSHCKGFEVRGFHTQYVQIKKLTNNTLNSLLVQDGLMVISWQRKGRSTLYTSVFLTHVECSLEMTPKSNNKRRQESSRIMFSCIRWVKTPRIRWFITWWAKTFEKYLTMRVLPEVWTWTDKCLNFQKEQWEIVKIIYW